MTRALTVLVIEDDADTRDLLLEILHCWGIDAKAATTGDDARKLLKGTTYDVIVIDFNLPDTTADVLLPELKRGRWRPAVLLTSAHLPEEVWERIDRASVTFLPKPFTMPAFNEALVRTVGRLRAENLPHE